MKNIKMLDFLDANQKCNPVHMSMMEVVDSTRNNTPDAIKVIMNMLDSSVYLDPETGNMVSAKSESGETVFQQSIEMAIRLMKYAKQTPKCSTLMSISCDDPIFAGLNRLAVCEIFGLLNTFKTSGLTNRDILCVTSSIAPSPRQNCRYSRLTNKAVEYLLSLGRPNTDLISEYYGELSTLAESSPDGIYEEIVFFQLNGKNKAVYVTVRNGVFYTAGYVSNNPSTDYSFDYVDSPVGYDRWTSEYDESLDDSAVAFDARSLLTNLWAAKKTGTFSSDREPSHTRTAMAALTPGTKPDFNSYDYVHITPEGEKAYDESRRVIASARGDVEYRKSVWFTRAYYAARGLDKRITLCKASIHHRKCAEVSNVEKPTMYT